MAKIRAEGLRDMLASFNHDVNQQRALRRAQAAQAAALDPESVQAFARPFPGSANVTVTKGGGLGTVAGLALATVGSLALGAAAFAVLHKPEPAPSVVPAVTSEPIGQGTVFDPSKYQFQVIPDE